MAMHLLFVGSLQGLQEDNNQWGPKDQKCVIRTSTDDGDRGSSFTSLALTNPKSGYPLVYVISSPIVPLKSVYLLQEQLAMSHGA